MNRIFEGTNEINRLIITGWLLKRAMSGQLALLPAIKKTMDEVMAGPPGDEIEGSLAAEHKLVANAKKLAMLIAGAASQKYMQKLADQQEIMGAIADMVIEPLPWTPPCCARASTSKSTAKQERSGDRHDAGLYRRRLHSLEAAAKKVIAAVAEGDMLRTQMAMRRLAKHEPVNVIALQEKIARGCWRPAST